MKALSKLACAWVLGSALLVTSTTALAEPGRRERRDPRLAMITPNGRPTIKIDKIQLPPGVANARGYTQYLKKRLLKESRRAKWGAGRNNVIQYRFVIKELSIVDDGDVVRVRCTAFGRLPRGQAAKSHLAFSGEARKRRQVVEHVLDIVARGVVTRLSELERIRRGDLQRSGVRAPRAVDQGLRR